MAAIPTTPSAPLSQALARRRQGPLPAIMLGLGLLAAIGFAALGYLESRRTEAVVVLVRDVPYGAQIVAADVSTIELPLHRPDQTRGIADPAAVVGQYAARDLGANDLARPAMLMAEPPGQPVYPSGQELAQNMVPLPFATATIGPLTFRDRVNIGFNDRSGSPDLCDEVKRATAGAAPTVALAASAPAQPRPFACRLISDVRVLYVDEAAAVAYLELSPYQAHTIWALQAAGVELWGERYGASSAPLPSLDRLDIGQVNAEELDAPPAPAGDGPALPGASAAVPGARP